MTSISSLLMPYINSTGTNSQLPGTDQALFSLFDTQDSQDSAPQQDSSDGIFGGSLLSLSPSALNMLSGISDSAASEPFSDSSGDGFITGDGPLPAFLAMVDTQLHLDPAHVKALQDIALKYRDAPRSEDTVQSIAADLHTAGID